MLELIVDYHLANTYGGDVNAYVDRLGNNVATMPDAQTVMGTLPFFLELEARGAAEANLNAALEKVKAKLESFKPPPAKATGARRRAKTGRRARKGTRRGRRGHF
jgi:hypothetical protein